MTTNYHTPISTGAAANASTFNTPYSALDSGITTQAAAIAAINGGSGVTDQQLKDWAQAGSYEITAATYHSTMFTVITTATVKWPDASAGTFTATTIDTEWEAIDAYTISHTASGNTVTQAAVTRDSNGNISTKPALTVA